MKPQVRTSDLLTQEVGDELIVYDTTRNRAHHLNVMARSIWNSCDGKSSVEEIASTVLGDLDAEQRNAIIGLALNQLCKARLVENADGEVLRGLPVTRREAVRRILIGSAVMLPVITSITSPTPVVAAGFTCGYFAPPNCSGSCPPGKSCTDRSACLCQ